MSLHDDNLAAAEDDHFTAFGDTITYIHGSDDFAEKIQGVIERDPPAPGPGQSAFETPKLTVQISRQDVADPDPGIDRIKLAVLPGDDPTEREIIRVRDMGDGLWLLELR